MFEEKFWTINLTFSVRPTGLVWHLLIQSLCVPNCIDSILLLCAESALQLHLLFLFAAIFMFGLCHLAPKVTAKYVNRS